MPLPITSYTSSSSIPPPSSSSWRMNVRKLVYMLSMPQEYALLKSALIVFGSLVLVPFWFSNSIVSRGFQYQNICHVGPPVELGLEGEGSNSKVSSFFSIPHPMSTSSSSPAVQALYGTYKSFEASSYYYTQILSSGTATATTAGVLEDGTNDEQGLPDTEIPMMIVKPRGWWSITSLGFWELSPKQQQYQYQLQQLTKRGGTNQNQNPLAASIQWDQSHKLQPKTSLSSSTYGNQDFRQEQPHSSSKNRWCLIPSGIDKEVLEQEEQLRQYGSSSGSTPLSSYHQDFDMMMNMNIPQQHQEQFGSSSLKDPQQLFQICTEPQPSIMSNGAQTPYFVELPLAPPPTEIWSLREALVHGGGMNQETNDEDAYVESENDDFALASSFTSGSGDNMPSMYTSGSAASSQTSTKTYAVEVQCHTPPTTLNLLSKGVIMDGNSNSGGGDPRNLNPFQEDYGQLSSNHAESGDPATVPVHHHMLNPPPQHLWGTLCIIAFLMIHTLTTNCYYSSGSGGGFSSSKTSSSTTKNPISLFFFHGGTSNLASQMQSQCSDATIANLTWNLTWLLWIGSKLEPLWGTMIFLGVNVVATILVSLFFVYTSSEKQNKTQQQQQPQQSISKRSSAIPPPPRGYVWVVTILAVATAQEYPLYSLYGATTNNTTKPQVGSIGTSTFWSHSSGRTIIEMMQFSFWNGTIQFNMLPLIIGIVHFILWSGNGIFGTTASTTSSGGTPHSVNGGGSATSSSTKRITNAGKPSSSTQQQQSKQQQDEEKEKQQRYIFLLLKAWVYCVMIGIILPHCLEIMASPQWILPSALLWHLWYATTRETTPNQNNRGNENEIHKDEETQQLLMDNGKGSDAQDGTGSVWSLPSTTTPKLDTNGGGHKKANSTGRLGMHMTNRPTVRYCNNDTSATTNGVGDQHHNDDDASGVWSLSSVSIDGGKSYPNPSNLLQYNKKRGRHGVPPPLQQQHAFQSIPVCAMYLGKLIQCVFWMSYFGINIIGCFFLEWNLVVGHIMTMWLCCGVLILHRCSSNNTSQSSPTSSSSLWRTPIHLQHTVLQRMCKLRPVWSLYHMVSASAMVGIDAMTLAGWRHAKVIIGISTYTQNYDFVWKVLACSLGFHLVSLIATASSSSWKQCTFAVPGYGLWNQAQTLGQEGVAWIFSLLFEDDEDDED